MLKLACAPYRKAGKFAYYFARGKLAADPIFPALLELGLLQGRSRILDLGCGQGLLAAWLQAALRLWQNGRWPPHWQLAPESHAMHGIELMPRDVRRANAALGVTGGVSQGDIRSADYGTADAVVCLDVMHYVNATDQHEILRRARAALAPGGLLLLRIADAGAGSRFRYTRCVDNFTMLFRGHRLRGTHCRTLVEWQALLRACAFDVSATPMSQGTRFANVLLIAYAR